MNAANRTPFEIKFDIQYGLCLNERHQRLYRHLKKWLAGINLLAGAGAVVTLAAQISALGIAVGLMVAITTVLENQISPTEKIYEFRDWHVRWGQLLKRFVAGEDPAALEADIAELHAACCPWIEGLRPVAYNDAATELGCGEGLYVLSRWQRFMATLA
ncbi:hypothetical protein GCM10007860_06240 [Chitiniphilus shinanonensis]|uniref:SMODS and SLOG-associating 2TM effector domain-containing protein n=2 Tax=Chitiniphilus shinanonensis TaxID=553088 RepID=A0ABQ6BN91_9NEIS|nr:hypothetical protein [Chitiniphilus shinanonensis]GLS03480.1 hypothetical protein GCM10007860_06240 [Chitiniphilus shinanonensis]